jgi:hypothetical protein
MPPAVPALSSLTTAALTSLESVLAGNYALKKTLTALVNQAIVNEANVPVLQHIAMTIEATPGTPPGIVSLAPSLATQTTALGFMQVVQSLETEINKL